MLAGAGHAGQDFPGGIRSGRVDGSRAAVVRRGAARDAGGSVGPMGARPGDRMVPVELVEDDGTPLASSGRSSSGPTSADRGAVRDLSQLKLKGKR